MNGSFGNAAHDQYPIVSLHSAILREYPLVQVRIRLWMYTSVDVMMQITAAKLPLINNLLLVILVTHLVQG